MVQKNPSLVVAIEDFNAKSSSFEGEAIENLTTQFGLHQAIKEPTHILDTSSLCIDLIFTPQPNLIIESGVHSSLRSNCHHHIIFAKFILKIVYSPPYLQEVWQYKDANNELIRRAINKLNSQRTFLNTNVNENVDIFNSTILNVLSNFIPYKFIVYDDKDPPWCNKKIRTLIQEKKVAFKNYLTNSRNIALKCRLKISSNLPDCFY